jgi:hypothetical protein
MNQELQHLAVQMYTPLFAERDTVKEAYDYAMAIAKASDNPAAVTTAIHVLMNTISKDIELWTSPRKVRVVSKGKPTVVDPEAEADELSVMREACAPRKNN